MVGLAEMQGRARILKLEAKRVIYWRSRAATRLLREVQKGGPSLFYGIDTIRQSACDRGTAGSPFEGKRSGCHQAKRSCAEDRGDWLRTSPHLFPKPSTDEHCRQAVCAGHSISRHNPAQHLHPGQFVDKPREAAIERAKPRSSNRRGMRTEWSSLAAWRPKAQASQVFPVPV